MVIMVIINDNQYFHNDVYSEDKMLGSTTNHYIIIIITKGYNFTKFRLP